MKLRLSACAFLLLAKVFAQNIPAEQARVLLQSGTYSFAESQLSSGLLRGEQGSNYLLRIVVLNRPMSPAEWSQWEALGAEIIGYLPINSYLIALPLQGKAAWDYSSSLPLVGSSPLLPGMKLSSQLSKNEIPDYAWMGSNVELLVVAAPKSEVDRTIKQLSKIGQVIETSPNGIRMLLRPDQINEVAALANVQYLQPKEAPGETENATGIKNHRSNAIRVPYAGGRNYRGTGVVVGHGDDGDIQSHIDFKGRVTQNFSGPSQGDHGDHVAGTIFGAGNLNPDGEGQAPGASLVYYNYPDNLNSVDAHYNSFGVRITASSYSNGCNAGYTAFTQQMDQDIIQNYHLMHVFSAGNAGTTNCQYGAGSGWGNITGGQKQGKNVVAVANLQNTDVIASSSSRGPAHDGRIKPDVAGLGTNVFSCVSPNSYGLKTGTSMSCPGVAGVLAQLYDAYRQTHSGQDPHGGLMKAILMNTADDLGQPGPDFIHGYGRVNALRAVKSIEQNQFMRDSLSQGETDTVRITIPSGTHALRVMLHWTDPAATLNAGRALVNNLNGVLHQGATSWLPWVLNPLPLPATLNSPAVRAVDSLNTAEQFEVLNPVAGDFELIINGSVAVGGSQEYYVTWTLVAQDVELTYPVGGEVLVPGQPTPIRWDSEPNGSPYQISLSQDNGTTWSVIANPIATADQATWLVPAGVNDQMWLRITRGSQGDSTDAVMSRIGVPTNLNHQWTCPDSFRVTWTAVAGAAGYVVYRLGAAYMDAVDTVATNSYVFTGSNPNSSEWVSVAALTPAGRAGKRAVAVEKPAGIQGCLVSTDVALTEVLNPSGRMPDCQPLGTVPVVVRLLNSATTAITAVPIAVQVANGTVQRDTLILSLSSAQSVTVPLNITVSLAGLGSKSVRIWTEMVGDQNRYNDTLVSVVEVVAAGLAQALPFTEDFSTFSNCPTTSNCGTTSCSLINGWVNAANGAEDQHDWRVHAGPSPTTGTGPTGGANAGGPTDKYLYLEATNCLNAEAVLYSPCINLANATMPQLSFAAHMLGTTQGSLHVDVLSGGRWYLDVALPLSGNKGSSWINVSTSLMPFNGQTIVLRFRGQTGTGQSSDIAIDAISISEVTSAPQAAIQPQTGSVCLNQVVALFDASSNTPTTWNWIVTPSTGVSFVGGTSSASANPLLSFSALGTFNVQLIAGNVFGSDTATLANPIQITAGAPLPFSEPFGPSIPLGWTVENPDGGITWVSTNSIGSTGITTNAATINFFNYALTPQEDGLITTSIDLTGTTLPRLLFDVAYAPYDANYVDGLRVEYSTNCGSTWLPTGYAKFGAALASKAAQTTTFTPSIASHWRRDTISLPAGISGPSVKFRFVGVNGYGNNLFIDNIQVFDLGATAPTATITSSATSDVCLLDTVYFAAQNPGNTLAQWTFGPGAVPSVATGPGNHAVYFFSQGSKTVTLQLNGPGGVDRDTIQLNAVPDLVGAWSFQTDTAFVFRGQATVSQGSVLNYLWDFGDGTTANTSSVRHLYAAAGSYPVQLSMDGPCNDVVFTTTAAISAIGLGESSLAWEVSPNPSTGMISLSQGPSPEYFSISDLAGRIITSGTWPSQDQIDLRAMATGCYVLELRRGDRLERIQIVKL